MSWMAVFKGLVEADKKYGEKDSGSSSALSKNNVEMPKLQMPKIDSGFYGHYDPKVYKARPIQTKSNIKGK